MYRFFLRPGLDTKVLKIRRVWVSRGGKDAPPESAVGPGRTAGAGDRRGRGLKGGGWAEAIWAWGGADSQSPGPAPPQGPQPPVPYIPFPPDPILTCPALAQDHGQGPREQQDKDSGLHVLRTASAGTEFGYSREDFVPRTTVTLIGSSGVGTPNGSENWKSVMSIQAGGPGRCRRETQGRTAHPNTGSHCPRLGPWAETPRARPGDPGLCPEPSACTGNSLSRFLPESPPTCCLFGDSQTFCIQNIYTVLQNSAEPQNNFVSVSYSYRYLPYKE